MGDMPAVVITAARHSLIAQQSASGCAVHSAIQRYNCKTCMPPHFKFLTGAPKSNEIDWAGTATLDDFQAPFRRWLGLQTSYGDVQERSAVGTQRSRIKWRVLEHGVEEQIPHPAHSTEDDLENNDTSELFTPTRSNHADFIEHSFLALDAIDSSQIRAEGVRPTTHGHGDDDAAEDHDTTFLSASLLSTNSLDSSLPSLGPSQGPQARPVLVPIAARNLTPLNKLPSAAYLQSIRPQTMTVTLLVGVISISATRTVSLRRGGQMDIIELIVGDESRSGFSITVWLPTLDAIPRPRSLAQLRGQSKETRDSETAFRAQIQSLKVADVVLIQTLALSTFRNQVFGQSLTRRSSSLGTRFLVLKGARLAEASETSLSGPGAATVSDKMQRVAAWVERFVGPAASTRRRDALGGSGNKKRKRGAVNDGRKRQPLQETSDFLPPDTPPP